MLNKYLLYEQKGKNALSVLASYAKAQFHDITQWMLALSQVSLKVLWDLELGHTLGSDSESRVRWPYLPQWRQ